MLLAAYIATAKSVHCDAFEITLCLGFCHNVCKQETQCNVCRCNIVPLTEVNLNDIINGKESEQTTLRYSLGEGLKGRKDSVSVRRYIAHMKSEGSFGDADLWEEMAKATGRDVGYIQYLFRRRGTVVFGEAFSDRRSGSESHADRS